MGNNMDWLSDFLDESIPLWRYDPVMFFREVLNFEPDDWQEAAAEDLARSPKVSIKSGQGVGKTAFEAATFLWFITCFPYPRIVATAPTKQQLHDVLWSEISKWMSHSPLLSMLLKWTKTYVYMIGNEKRWFGVARTATKPENMQGFHEDNMLFIVDEASGVADPIMEAVLGTLSGENNKLLMCGNPTKTTGTFYDSHTRDRALYKCHTVSSEDSKRTNKENIESLIRKYGWDSNVVRVRVRGEFPKQEDDVFIGLQLVEQAGMMECNENIAIRKISIGVDVARYGNDETIVIQNVDGEITMPIAFRGKSLMQTAGEIVRLYRELVEIHPEYQGPIYIIIDDTGLGGGVTDRLEEVKQEYNLQRMIVIPVNAASSVPDDVVEIGSGKIKACDLYDNLTTYMWANIRDKLEQKTLCLQKLYKDNELVAQLTCRKYRITSRGKIRLETKDDMRKRGIGSPDRADALALSLYNANVFDLRNLI